MEAKFEHSILENDIERLSKEVQERKLKPEQAEVPEHEIVRSVLGEKIQAQPPVQQATPQQTTVLPAYMQQEPPEIQLQVEKLIDLLFHKGLDAAIKEARKQEPLVLDAFHDSLTSKLYSELKKRKLI